MDSTSRPPSSPPDCPSRPPPSNASQPSSRPLHAETPCARWPFVSRDGARAKSSLRGWFGDEGHHGDNACRHALVFGVLRIPLGLIGVLRIALCAAQFNDVDGEVL